MMNHTDATTPISLGRYPVLCEALAIVFSHVLEGMTCARPVHMSLGYDMLLSGSVPETERTKARIRQRLSAYRIAACRTALFGNVMRFAHPNGRDGFIEGEFIYTCRSGTFHIVINAVGMLSEIITDYDDQPPGFLRRLVADFPGVNLEPDAELLSGLAACPTASDRRFVAGLKPYSPIRLQVS